MMGDFEKEKNRVPGLQETRFGAKWWFGVLLALGVLNCLTAPIAEATALYIIYGMTYPSATFVPSTGFSVSGRGPARGGGFLVDFRVVKRIEMELGALYMLRGFNTLPDNQPQTETTLTTVQIPLMLNFRPLPFFVLGVEGYYARGIGTVQTFPIGNPSAATTEAYGVNLKVDDYGLVVGVGIHTRIIPYLDILIRGQYLMGMQNASAISGSTVTLSDFQGFVGLKLAGH